jgi:hypothetical protein
MHITLQLARDHTFQNQNRRAFTFQKGATLSGHIRLFATTWPRGVYHHEDAGKLGVEFIFPYENASWLYRGAIDCRELWPAPGATVQLPIETDQFPVGPILGMRDDREHYNYFLPDNSERSFPLKYVGFETWVALQQPNLKIKIQHFLPGDYDDSHVTITHHIPIETILFLKKLKLSYDAEGFLDDAWQPHPFVHIEQCSTNVDPVL